MCQSAATPYKIGDLFRVPVNGGEDAELIWLIGRILDAAAADSICEIQPGCSSEYRCIVAAVIVHRSLLNIISSNESTDVEV